MKQGLSFGAVWTVYHVVHRVGIEPALGTTRTGKLALWHVIARVIARGSRLSAVRLAMAHAACDVLGLSPIDEDALYENLDWLANEQAAVEAKLFAQRTKTKPVSLFLYDATSRMENRMHVRLDQQWPITTFGSGFSEGDQNKAVAQTFTVGENGVLAYVEMVLSEQTGNSSAGMVIDLPPVVNGAPGDDDSALTRLTIPNGLLAEPNTHEGFAIPFLSPPIAVKRGQKLAIVLRALPGGFYGASGDVTCGPSTPASGGSEAFWRHDDHTRGNWEPLGKRDSVQGTRNNFWFRTRVTHV